MTLQCRSSEKKRVVEERSSGSSNMEGTGRKGGGMEEGISGEKQGPAASTLLWVTYTGFAGRHWRDKAEQQQTLSSGAQPPGDKIKTGNNMWKPASSTTRQALTWNPQGKRREAGLATVGGETLKQN